MPPGTKTRWPRWIAAGAVLTIVAVACRNDDQGIGVLPVDCPAHEFAIDTGGGVVSNIPLAELSDEIPEFHDCQRFIDDAGARYGPLVAIWAADRLDIAFAGATADPPAADTATAGTPAAVPVVPAVTPWVPVAVIHNFDNVRYAPLSIEHRFNCVYLHRSNTQWSARIVAHRKRPDLCKGSRELNDPEIVTARTLSVRVDPTVRPPHLPSVSRWDRDPQNGHYYIGIRCADEWCEIGDSAGFRSSTPVADDAVGAAYLAAFEPVADVPVGEQMKMRVISGKGWYDQQQLAEAGSPPQLSAVTGTIIPHPVVDVIKEVDGTFQGRWIPTAYVHVDADYHGKVPFESGGMNKLYLCEDAPDRACAGVTPEMRAAAKCGGTWWGRIDRPQSGTSIGCVKYDGKPGVIPAGAARWRWMEDDETTWVRCGSGCCSNV